jgi:hypothetical protein
MNIEEMRELAQTKINRYFYSRPELYLKILETIADKNLPRKEVIALFRLGLNKVPICNKEDCVKKVKMASNGKYRNYCSGKCSANSKETRSKCEETNLEKYGVKNVGQSSEIKDRILETLTKNHGSHHMKLDKYREMTSERSFDVDKMRLSRYKNTYKRFSRFAHKVIPLFMESDFQGGGYDKVYNWECLRCDGKFSHWYHNGSMPKCPTCDKCELSISNAELEIIEFLNKYKCVVSHSNRLILENNLELDIYLKNHKLAIEYNGNFWHSELAGKGRSYHIRKTQECKRKGIRLIHIFEDEYVNKKTIVLDRIRGLIKEKKWSIFARKCEVKIIDTKIKNAFLNKYHLQGEDKSSVKLGLFNKGRLVSVMTFCKQRKCLGQKHEEQKWELSRFASIGKFNVVGGCGKLLEHFKRNFEWNEITSYADLRWSEGNVYQTLGFDLSHISPPNYWYMNNKNYLQREHRYKYVKHRLKDLLINFDNTKTEWENMKANGYDRIWDCGNLVYKLYK